MRTGIIAAVLFNAMLVVSPIVAQESSVADFTKVRMAYAGKKDFNPGWDDHADRKKITDLWDGGKVDEGIKLAEQWLERHPVDAIMHSWYAYFLKKQGDVQGYFRHMHSYQGLLASITSSGSGLMVDSPMKVISVTEEYTVLKALGAKLIKQSLVANKAGVACDQMECDIKGKKITLYFDVTIPMAHTRKMLRGTDDAKKDPPKQQK